MDRMSTQERLGIIHPDDRATVQAYFQKFPAARDEEIITAEYRAADQQGQWKWFCVRGRAFQRNESGAVTHVLNVIENITERKKAETELLQLKDDLAQKAEEALQKSERHKA